MRRTIARPPHAWSQEVCCRPSLERDPFQAPRHQHAHLEFRQELAVLVVVRDEGVDEAVELLVVGDEGLRVVLQQCEISGLFGARVRSIRTISALNNPHKAPATFSITGSILFCAYKNSIAMPTRHRTAWPKLSSSLRRAIQPARSARYCLGVMMSSW